MFEIKPQSYPLTGAILKYFAKLSGKKQWPSSYRKLEIPICSQYVPKSYNVYRYDAQAKISVFHQLPQYMMLSTNVVDIVI